MAPGPVLRSLGDSDSESDSVVEAPSQSLFTGHLPIVAAIFAVAAGGLLCMSVASSSSRPFSLLQGSHAVGLFSELASFRGSSLDGPPELVIYTTAQPPQRQQVLQLGGQVEAAIPEGGATAAAVAQQVVVPIPASHALPRGQTAPASAMSGALAIAPKEHLHDGNMCADDEEEHGGLCYEKCSTLTGGQFNFRQSAWTCCLRAVCSPITLLMGRCCRHHMGFCSGFDIAGLNEGDHVCPHQPGVCLEDEELFLDLCFMKCSLLTEGAFPHRVAASTCCKHNDMSCLLDSKVKMGPGLRFHGEADTTPTYNVGGGCGHGRDATQCRPHEPQVVLTEATS